jgi:hypothetical protein
MIFKSFFSHKIKIEVKLNIDRVPRKCECTAEAENIHLVLPAGKPPERLTDMFLSLIFRPDLPGKTPGCASGGVEILQLFSR